MEDLRPRTAILVICRATILFVLASHVALGATAEHTATLEAFTGEVKILQGGSTSVSATQQMILRSKDVIYTGKSSSATIVFPDGSAIQLEPKTRFTIQLLEYVPGGARKRSFTLHYGAVIARISHFFGAGSKASISTPTAVAAARGTGFRLSYEPVGALTGLSVTDGTVEFTCGGIMTLCHAGESIFAHGNSPGTPGSTPPDVQSMFGNLVDSLQTYDNPPSSTLPALTDTLTPTEPPADNTEPAPTPGPLTTEPLVVPPTSNPTPTPTPGNLPPLTPAPPSGGHNSSIQGMNWALPGLLGAGVLAAALSGGGGSSRGGDPVQPVPEPAGLLVLGFGISAFVGLTIKVRKSRHFNA